MIENTINSIIDAETRADAIEKEAMDKARDIVKTAQEVADKIKLDTDNTVKASIKSKRAEWDNIANANAQVIIDEAKAQAQELIKSNEDKINEMVDEVVDIVIKKYSV